MPPKREIRRETMHYCSLCGKYISNNKFNIANHEKTEGHQENLKRALEAKNRE